MRIFVDGYNLIFAASHRMGGFDIEATEAAREKLLGMLAKYRSVKSGKLLVLFDGGAESAGLPRRVFQKGLDVLYSDPDRQADDDIKTTVSHDGNPRDIRVVTSDRAIQNFVKRFGAQVVESRAFLDEMNSALEENALPQNEPIEKYEGPPAGETDYWMRVFGEADEEDG